MWGSHFYFPASCRLKTLALVSMAIPVYFPGLSRPVKSPLGRQSSLAPSQLPLLSCPGAVHPAQLCIKKCADYFVSWISGSFLVFLKNYQILHLIEKEPHLHFFFLMLVLAITLHGLFLYFSNETLVISRQQPGAQRKLTERGKRVRAPSQCWGWPGRPCSLCFRGVWGS